jgi:hypothetical protein
MMQKEYDFSKGVRGKFYRKNLKLQIPVYLDNDNFLFVQELAEKKKTDVASVVNQLIKSDRQLIKAIA